MARPKFPTRPKVRTLEDVAREALNAILAKSIETRKEYGGVIYQDGSLFRATAARQGEPNSVNVGQNEPNCGCPEGTQPVAYYHTHPLYKAAGFTALYNEFSDEDKGVANDHKLDAYLGTLDGSFLKYDYRTEKVFRLGGRLKNAG